jgi:hypothetical protein
MVVAQKYSILSSVLSCLPTSSVVAACIVSDTMYSPYRNARAADKLLLARSLSYKGFPYYPFIQCRMGPSFAAAQLSIESGNSRANASSISNSELLITAK